ncbi:protein artichoke-like [Amyelois transitella]|uniref:protein artichoke-like n=1 Tax=Amyelois transitella TaxID=680683 RepID=UPI0029907DD1|nr:protein artichoke-like [Amyelois transitella]
MMNFLYFLILFFVTLPNADFTTWPLESKGCNEELDIDNCLIRFYCFNVIYWSAVYNNYNSVDGYSNYQSFREFRSFCNNGNYYTKIVVMFRSDNEKELESSVYSSDTTERRSVNAISELNIINQNYNTTPNLPQMDRLHNLNLSHNNITKAKLTNPVNLFSLTEIDYSYNKIVDFDVSGEFKFVNLTSLIVSHNEITKIPDGIFDGFSKLKKLDMSYNIIENLQIESFEGIKALINLNLSHNNINDVGNSLFRFKKLKYLDLSYNKIQIIKTDGFKHLQSLETLDLKFNSLIAIEKTSLEAMPVLRFLNLSNNLLESIEKDFFLNNSYLTDVDISSNNLHSLPKYLFKDKTLMTFSIEKNNLEGSLVKGIFDGLTSVTYLNLTNQLLTSIQDFAFFGLQKLKWLNLSNNNISILSKKSFRTVLNLINLDLSNNKITTINFEKDDLINLKHLSVQNNYLNYITSNDYVNLGGLHFLNVAFNNISKLEPETFKSLQDLIYFDISNNPLSGSLETGTFKGLNSLPKLDLSGNQLRAVENNSLSGMYQLTEFNASHGIINRLDYNTFMNTGLLKFVDLSFNRISTFLVNSTHLSNITTLMLNNNMLSEVCDSTFKGLHYLEIIGLGTNHIMRISIDAFKDQTNLKYLDLSFNNNMKFNVSNIKFNTKLNTLYLSGLKSKIDFTEENFLPIKTLNLAQNGIENIKILNLKPLFQLEDFSLSFNNIQKLRVGDLCGMKSLLSLDLSNNNITSIQPNVFEYNTLLTFLNISHNMLSELNYGIFQHLIHLKKLDLSYNKINDLRSERFYELPNLLILIVDHNKINLINAYEFGTLDVLSIGENLLPCDLLVNLDKAGTPFKLTAIHLVYNKENFHGITCNNRLNSETISSKNRSDLTKISENNQVFFEIRDELVKIASGQKSQIEKDHVIEQYPKSNINELSQTILKQNEQLVELANFSAAMVKNTNDTNILLQRMLKRISEYRTTVFSKNNVSLDNVLPYINEIRQELEDRISSEKKNIMAEINSKLSSIKSNFDNRHVELSTTAPALELSQKFDNSKVQSESVFTETCVGIILVILVGYILYKVYKSKIYIRPRRSSSIRELESPNL